MTRIRRWHACERPWAHRRRVNRQFGDSHQTANPDTPQRWAPSDCHQRLSRRSAPPNAAPDKMRCVVLAQTFKALKGNYQPMSRKKEANAKQTASTNSVFDSCLVTKLGYYIEVTDEERELLASLEKAEQPVSAGEQIFAGGDKNDKLFVVKHGWLYTCTYLPDGGRLVVRVYHAGDIIGMPALSFNHHTVNLRAVTDGCLCPFPEKSVGRRYKRCAPDYYAAADFCCARRSDPRRYATRDKSHAPRGAHRLSAFKHSRTAENNQLEDAELFSASS